MPIDALESTSRRLVLARRPSGMVEDSDFEMLEGAVPEAGPGEVLVRTLWLSFDPTQRGWLSSVPTYLPPVAIGEVVRAQGIGEVMVSNDERFRAGDLVQGMVGWQEHAILGPRSLGGASPVVPGFPPTYSLGVLGVTGLTAYFGLTDVGSVAPGDVVLVSGAAGATGSVVGQIARATGARAIGIAGGTAKCAWVRDVARFDDVIDYKAEDVRARLRELAPKGVDVYFDNVGMPLLDVALGHLAMRARVVICGAIATGYDMERLPAGPANYLNLISRRARMQGFLILDYAPRFTEGITALATWIAAGAIHVEEDIQAGLENCPATLRRLFEGSNRGKQLLAVAAPSAG